MQSMTTNKSFLILFFLLSSTALFAQGGNLSSSPYSLFGLGVGNNLNPGKTNAMGNTGIAMSDALTINALNPAALSTISTHQFIYDIGLKFQYGLLNQGNGDESRINSNFSNLSLAVKATPNSAFGLSLKPKTDVGYLVSGIERSIEGSNQTFFSTIFGAGGINNLNITYANSSFKKLRLGFSTSFLFGEISETETNFISFTNLQIEDRNVYRGVQFDLGAQYNIRPKTSLGLVFKTSSNLSATRERTVSQPNTQTITDEQDLDSFELPMEFGIGLSSYLKNNVLFNFDIKRSFWDATNQEDEVGRFVDQNLIGFGVQYIPRENGLKFWERTHYRMGFQLDTGYLQVNEQQVNGYQLTAGLGLPLTKIGSSSLNLSYSFQSNGVINNGLIREHYHTLTINLSFSSRWFIKRTVD